MTFLTGLATDAATDADGRRADVRLDPSTMRPAPWTDHARQPATPLLKP